MGLETATHINDLNSSNPLGSDTKAQGDDHIRLIKDVLKRDLPLTTPATTLGLGLLTSPTNEDARLLVGASNSPYRNRVVNGDFKVDTRNKGVATTIFNSAGSIKYTADRWFAWCSGGGNMQITRAISGGTNRPTLQIASASGAGAWNFGTRLRSLDVRDLSSDTTAKVITLSVSMTTPRNITWTVYIPNITPGGYGTIASPTKGAIATGVFTAGTGVYSAQITLGVSASTLGLEIIFSAGEFTAGENIQFYNVQLEAGAIATSNIVFESVDEPLQKMRCRYFCQEVSASVRAPSTSNGQIFSNSVNWSEMRTTPTVTLTTAGTTNLSTGQVLAQPTPTGARFEHTSTGAGDCYSIANIYLLEAEIT